MRKKLGYVFVTISLIILVVYIFRYKIASTVEGKIPKNATEVVHIDLRQIEHHLLFDAIKNPLKYIDFKAKKSEKISLRRAVSIPRDLMLFTNDSHLKNAWFSSFVELKKSDKFKRYLLQEGFKEITNEAIEIFSKGRIVVGVSNDTSIVAFKKRQDVNVVEALQNLFQETSFYEEDDDLMKSIATAESDVFYTSTTNDFLEVNVENGLLEIKGKVVSELFKNNYYTESSENSVGFIATQLKKEHPFFESLVTEDVKQKFDDFTKLSLDSIVNKWNGGIVVNLKSVEKKSDTIVTYEYDDDFNKIEKKSIQELSIPDVTIALRNDDALYNYFSENNAIKTMDQDTLFTSIPLYKMFAKKQDGELYIFTKNQLAVAPKKEKYKLKAFLDLQRYIETPFEFSPTTAKNSYVHLIKNTAIELSSNDEFFMQVRLKESNRNFLGQLIKPD